ncbi:MAG: hypothetical protein AW10_01315 [Candidatus Accumulibacter appositus]|uniref:Uncharacterized protein n=1 Tax=Candidatus Accumulibacter appositus TaxID=1454003 RepID=A0A011P0Z3_9PROT|nr:MAG: hypothetical protein AW10_01315 [Candidatus Accumulibacter appositus]
MRSRSAAADSCTITRGLGAGAGFSGGSGGDTGPGGAGGGATVSNRTALPRWSSSAAFSPIACSSAASVSHTLATIARAAVCRSSFSAFIASKMSHAPVRTASSSSRALARVWRMATSEVSIVAPARVVTTAALSALSSPASKASAERAVCRRRLSLAAGNKADFSFSVLSRLLIGSRASRALA